MFIETTVVELTELGIQFESGSALDRHLGESDRNATQADIVSTAGYSIRDQALDEPQKSSFGIEIQCWR